LGHFYASVHTQGVKSEFIDLFTHLAELGRYFRF